MTRGGFLGRSFPAKRSSRSACRSAADRAGHRWAAALANGGKLWTGETRPCDELLADVYDAVRDHLNGRHARVLIGGLSGRIGGSWHRVADRLVRAGVLARQRPWGVGQTRYPVLDPAARQAVLAQAWAAATSTGPPPSAAAVVLQLSGGCRLRKRIAPDRRARIELLKLTLRMPQPPFSPDIAAAVEVLLCQVAALARRIDSGPG
jgi:Golgi phosphoprotein 3 (GPP34)